MRTSSHHAMAGNSMNVIGMRRYSSVYVAPPP
jgi:hypothetical protein